MTSRITLRQLMMIQATLKAIATATRQVLLTRAGVST